jgi:FlaA1/EpsC-like NDP-sugar epimerase
MITILGAGGAIGNELVRLLVSRRAKRPNDEFISA